VTTDPRPASEAGEPAATEPASATARPARSNLRRNIILLLVGVILLDIVSAIVVPPFPKGQPGQPINGIGDLILANLEFPQPEVIWPAEAAGQPLPIVGASVSITNSLFTMWIVMAILLIVFVTAGRMLKPVPGRLQNAVEFAWESLENWAVSLGGPDARTHVPLFAAFFLFILFSNWSGLLPIVGKVEILRAPTSDVNVTIGLALVAFIYFHFQGFRRLGVRGYLGKFFVFTGFRQGIASGVIDLFVGLIEFLLEFIKPVTLAMRLFGNIYGGEVALGVITGLTIAIVPAAMVGLEFLLNFMQALIFSVLTLMFTIIATEAHDDHAEHDVPEGNLAPDMTGAHPAPAH